MSGRAEQDPFDHPVPVFVVRTVVVSVAGVRRLPAYLASALDRAE
jgi:hypothetical protein